jgi:hypothetical protein
MRPRADQAVVVALLHDVRAPAGDAGHGHASDKGGGVELVLRVQDQYRVHRFRAHRVGPLRRHHVKEVGGMKPAPMTYPALCVDTC